MTSVALFTHLLTVQHQTWDSAVGLRVLCLKLQKSTCYA